MKIIEKKSTKILKSKNYNYCFDKKTGFFIRWGKTKEDNPEFSPFGPEIADIEISTICHGIGKTGSEKYEDCTPCKFCYKSNTGVGKNMSFETYKQIFDKFPKSLVQIAYGVGSLEANPDLWKIMEYTREKGVIPNITINGQGLTKKLAKKIVNVVGGVSVSRYSPKDVCYNAVKLLTDAGGKQINIHQLISKETLQGCYDLIEDIKNDERLSKLNASVFLMLKKRGRGKGFNYVSKKEYKDLVDILFKSGIRFGFDSCSSNSFTKNLKNKELEIMVEPCESGIFSIYVDVEGKVHPCSFAENVEWPNGIDLTKINDFDKEVWNSELMKTWRKKLLGNCRNCPIYTEIKDI